MYSLHRSCTDYVDPYIQNSQSTTLWRVLVPHVHPPPSPSPSPQPPTLLPPYPSSIPFLPSRHLPIRKPITRATASHKIPHHIVSRPNHTVLINTCEYYSFQPKQHIIQITFGINDRLDNVCSTVNKTFIAWRKGQSNSIFRNKTKKGLIWHIFPLSEMTHTPTSVT